MITRIALLALAGSLGTLARVGVYGLTARLLAGSAGAHLPIATLAVNVAGSLAFGVIWTMGEGAPGVARVSADARMLALAGFMGAFTTFSTFAFETGEHLRRGAYGMAFVNVLANCVLGVGALFVGMWLARTVTGAGVSP